jgi:uncharacterized coiled-coil protein SlyX
MMGNLIRLKDGTLATVLSGEDLLYLIETQMGQEMKEAVVEWMNEMDLEHADDEECIHELNELISEDHVRHKQVMEELRTETDKLSGLIRQKDPDRSAISHTVGRIAGIIGQEVRRC